MIAVQAGMRVLVATKPVDFRRGADSLAARWTSRAPITSIRQRSAGCHKQNAYGSGVGACYETGNS